MNAFSTHYFDKATLIPECSECLFEVLYNNGLLSFQMRRHWFHVLPNELGLVIVSDPAGNVKPNVEIIGYAI